MLQRISYIKNFINSKLIKNINYGQYVKTFIIFYRLTIQQCISCIFMVRQKRLLDIICLE